MIIDNTYMPQFQMRTRMGPDYLIYAFGGAVPASVEDIPFEMFIENGHSDLNSNIDENFRLFNWAGIYNNMITSSLITANQGATSVNTIQFTQKSSSVVCLPKLGYYDYSVSKYRHIPQTVETNLGKYLNTPANPHNSNTYSPLDSLFIPGGPTKHSYGCFFGIGPENLLEGFHFDLDFATEVGIDSIEIKGPGTNMFEGDMRVFKWDETLNAGAGDWVLIHTLSPIEQVDNQTIVLAEQAVTTKLRIELDEGDSSNIYSVLDQFSFLGATPAEPVGSQAITWAIVIPVSPGLGAYMQYTHEGAFLLATAGGPEDDAEFIFSRKTPDRGRDCALLAGDFTFKAREV